MTNIILSNLGTVNKNVVYYDTDKGSLKLYFSYETPVSFIAHLHTTNGVNHVECTRQNDWSVTTGKMLNKLEPDKSKRVTGEVFNEELRKALASL